MSSTNKQTFHEHFSFASLLEKTKFVVKFSPQSHLYTFNYNNNEHIQKNE